jgi:hypothetical protein
MRAVLTVALCAGCSAHAEVAGQPTADAQKLPPQVMGWQPLANLSKQYIGNRLSIKNDSIEFSIAGKFHVSYAGTYGPGKLYKIIDATPLNGLSKNFLCAERLSYIAIIPGQIKIIHEPILSFIAFDGTKMPVWQDHNTNEVNADCAEFSYGAPLKQ